MPKDPLHRLLLINALSGCAVAVLLGLAMLAFDTAGLRHLIFQDSAGLLAFGLLVFGFAITASSVMMGTAVMSDASYRQTLRRRAP
jgi:hypothetical protein